MYVNVCKCMQMYVNVCMYEPVGICLKEHVQLLLSYIWFSHMGWCQSRDEETHFKLNTNI